VEYPGLGGDYSQRKCLNIKPGNDLLEDKANLHSSSLELHCIISTRDVCCEVTITRELGQSTFWKNDLRHVEVFTHNSYSDIDQCLIKSLSTHLFIAD